MAIPSYLLQRHNTFYFRSRIPLHLVPIINKREVCISLRTSNKHEALARSGILASNLHKALSSPDLMAKKPSFNLLLEMVRPDGTQLRADFDPDKPSEAEWVRENLADALTPARKAPSALTFSKLRDGYIKYLEGRDKRAALDSCKRTYKLFVELIGDISAHELTQGKLGEFKRMAEQLPVGYTKNSAYKGKLVRELLSIEGKKIAPKTLSMHVANIVSLSQWARGNYDGIQELTAKGIVPPKTAEAHEERDAFTHDDLTKLFASENFDSLDDACKWLLRLGALTGARIEELCQLDLHGDIRQTAKGIWYLSINTEGDKSVKTASAKREIPLHSKLLELGVLEYFEAQRKAGSNRPFESKWAVYRDKWSKYASKWFGQYKTKLLGKIDGKVFHSFRHTVIDTLKKSGAEENRVGAFAGHSVGTITFSRYGKPFGAADLKELVELIDLPIR